MGKVIGFANGLPIEELEEELEEERAVQHDPHSGRFMGGSGAIGKAKDSKAHLATQTALYGQGKVTAFHNKEGKLHWAVNGTPHSSKSLQKALAMADEHKAKK